jgi:predicted porin
MKKSLIALALMGAFSGGAIAQSNVTLYGILDVNLKRTDPNGPGAATTALDGGYQSGNRWGLRGTEALGGGMSAIFTVEGGFDIDTGMQAQGGRLFGRQAWAGLQWDAAKVALVGGRLATLSSGTGSFDMIGAIDPFLTGFDGMQNIFTMAGATRADNTIGLIGGPWAGFKAGVTYTFNFNGAEAAGSSNNTRLIGFGANYTWGPLFVAVTHDQVKHSTASWDTGKYTQLGGTFDFKVAKLHAGYAMEDKIRLLGTANSNAYAAAYTGPGRDADAWFIGATVPLAGGNLLALYGDRDADPVAGEANRDGPDLTHWTIGYTYPLSRRTNLYASFANKDGDGSNKVGAVGNTNNSFDRKVYAVGVRHLF